MKAARSADFKHLLWRRHPDDTWWDGCRPEILASDGRVVRRLSSQHQHISFQAFEDQNSARDVCDKIEASVAQGVALMGYSMFSQHEAVAILHTADNLDPGWVAFPHRRTNSSTVPTLPLTVADVPKLRIVGGAEVRWASGDTVLDAALEQRGERFAKTPFAFNALDHVSSWEIWGRVGRGADTKQLRLVKRGEEPHIRRVSDQRLGGRFPLDPVIWREFQAEPTFKLWFLVTFDRELLCLPNDWLRFWMQVEL